MAKIEITGIIGSDFSTSNLKAFLDAHANEPADVFINSAGGSVFEALAAYHAIVDHGDVTAIVDGIAASAASLIAMGAATIVMREGSLMMIHRASSMTLGDADTHRKSAAVLDKIDAEVTGIYARRSGMTKKRVATLLDAESWFNAEEAKAAGLADESDDAASGDPVLFDPKQFLHPPTALIARMELIMATKPNTEPNPNPTPPASTPPADVTGDILARAAVAGLSARATADVVLQAGGDINVARNLIIDLAAKAAGDQHHTPSGTLDDPGTLATGVVDLLYAKMSGKQIPAGSPARGLIERGRTELLDLGVMIVQARGENIRSWAKDKLAQQVMMSAGLHSTSDFPTALASAGARVLADSYAAAQSPLKQIARRRTAADFRAISVLRMGEAPELLEVKEGAEVTAGTMDESVEAFALRTFARIFGLTRQAVINDDIGIFSDMVIRWGRAAAAVEANQLYALIAGDGPVLEDGKSLWHVDHGNVGGGSQLSIAALDVARTAIRTAKSGNTPLGIVPRYLVVGPLNETRGQVIVNAATSFVATTIEAANPFASTLELLVEPRIEDYSWHLFADPLSAEVLSFANLADANAPEMETRAGWEVLGTEFRCVYDFGAGVTGYRGAFKDPGEEPTA